MPKTNFTSEYLKKCQHEAIWGKPSYCRLDKQMNKMQRMQYSKFLSSVQPFSGTVRARLRTIIGPDTIDSLDAWDDHPTYISNKLPNNLWFQFFIENLKMKSCILLSVCRKVMTKNLSQLFVIFCFYFQPKWIR